MCECTGCELHLSSSCEQWLLSGPSHFLTLFSLSHISPSHAQSLLVLAGDNFSSTPMWVRFHTRPGHVFAKGSLFPSKPMYSRNSQCLGRKKKRGDSACTNISEVGCIFFQMGEPPQQPPVSLLPTLFYIHKYEGTGPAKPSLLSPALQQAGAAKRNVALVKILERQKLTLI